MQEFVLAAAYREARESGKAWREAIDPSLKHAPEIGDLLDHWD